MFDQGGGLLARWGTPDATATGSFAAPHGLAVDSQCAVYVSEVSPGLDHGVGYRCTFGSLQRHAVAAGGEPPGAQRMPTSRHTWPEAAARTPARPPSSRQDA